MQRPARAMLALAFVICAGAGCLEAVPAQEGVSATSQGLISCTSHCDCPVTASCTTQGACAPRSGPLPACSCDSHCGPSGACRGNTCYAACNSHCDCPYGSECVAGACMVDPSPGSCSCGPRDCAPGERCSPAGWCVAG